jgi:hypothetical protein
MMKQTLGALGLSLLVTQLAGCFIVVDDTNDGQLAVTWSFSYGGTAQSISQACSDLGVNKMDIRTQSSGGQVRYFRYDCTAGSVVTSPPLPEGTYAVSVELRFDNDSNPENGPLPLFGPVAPGNNANCTNGFCDVFGGEVSNVGTFIFDIPTTTLQFTPVFDTVNPSLSGNCGGSFPPNANVSTQIVNFTQGGQSIILPLAGLVGGTAQSSFTGQSNICQPRGTQLAMTAVLFPETYNVQLIGRNSVGQTCFSGGSDVDILDFTGGTANIGPVVSYYLEPAGPGSGCTLPKR